MNQTPLLRLGACDVLYGVTICFMKSSEVKVKVTQNKTTPVSFGIHNYLLLFFLYSDFAVIV